MTGRCATRVGPRLARLLVAGAAILAAIPATAEEQPIGPGTAVPDLRRVYVPAERLEAVLEGDWQPIELPELRRLVTQVRAARRERPATVLEQAEYSAVLIDGDLSNARLEWSVQRPDAELPFLPVGRMNLNVSSLDWLEPGTGGSRAPAIWGSLPAGSTAILVDRARGKLVGQWSLPGRKLAASTEFEFEIPPATISRLVLRIPAGLALTATAGQLSGPAPARETGWNDWRLILGSETSCRLRVAPPPDPGALRPLVVVRSNVSYFVRSEAVRLLAEFDADVLESPVQELRLLVDPEVQVTAVEYGDDGALAWHATRTAAGHEIVVRLPDMFSGEGHVLQVQGIAPVNEFATWTLPRILLQNCVVAAERVTLRLQPPFLAADVKADGWRQIELTAGAAEGEVLVFRKLRDDASIAIVPTDTKPDLTCRAVTLIQPDLQQWSLISRWEWTAAAGSTFTAACFVPETWEIVDVQLPSGERDRELSGWDIQEGTQGRRVLSMYFLNAIKPDHPQQVRIAARRLAPLPEERTVVPPLKPLEAREVEHVVMISTEPGWRPVIDGAVGIEMLQVRDLPPETAALDFLASPLTDPAARSILFRSVGTAASGRLHVEPVARPQESNAASAQYAAGTETSPQSPGVPRPGSAGLAAPVSLAVTAEVSGIHGGYDRYIAAYRLEPLSGDDAFVWNLPESAELIGASLDGRRVTPLVYGTRYSVTALPAPRAGAARPGETAKLAIEYRVGAAMHLGPNRRPLVLPECDRPVVQFAIDLVLPDGVRLQAPPDGLSFDGSGSPPGWRRRLLGPFARADGQALFNPFSRESWSALWRADANAGPERARDTIWRGTAAAPPIAASFVVWNAIEAACLAWTALLSCLAAGVVLRLAEHPWSRGISTFALAGFCLGALILSPVSSDLAASALTGTILAILLPHRFIIFVRRPARREESDVPVGSTQSFVPIAGVLLTICGVGLAAQAQDEPVTKLRLQAGSTEGRKVFEVVVPVGADGKPAGRVPVGYVPASLLKQLRRGTPARLPPYLIGASTFDGQIDEAGRLSVTAIFMIHVLSYDRVVPVELPLGIVNLGGKDACLVDGRPHPIVAGPAGRGLIVELTGAEPRASPPALPEPESAPERDAAIAASRDSLLDEARAERTFAVELHLYPAIESGRSGLLTATVAIPSGCRTRATFSSATAQSLMGIAPGDSSQPLSRIAAYQGKTVVNPGPANQLVYFWSAGGVPAIPARAEVQVGASCLADVFPSLIEMRLHLSYHVQSGQVDALEWYVPAGYVLEAVQAPQLAGYRFEPANDGGRRMLIEFARPQSDNFSLAARFALPVDRRDKPFAVPLLDPLRVEDANVRQVGLRFNQIAVRQPTDLRVSVTAARSNPPLKSRPVDEFLKEWNAAGARPQQAFDLERNFDLNFAVESLSGGPVVRSSSVATFHPGRVDWTYTAEVSQPAVAQFLYRLHVDPRLRIRSISVQEDGAERLLRWSPLRETVVLFLNDRTNRSQTVRIDASMPAATSQDIELPRIRFLGATPQPERISLYCDDDITVRLVNPEDFPLPPAGESGPDTHGDHLAARIDVLPEQAIPRVRIEPVLPVVSAETATVLHADADDWSLTTCLAFQVASGRVGEFLISLPEALAAKGAIRSVPESRIVPQPAVDGRVTVAFYPDDPALRRFAVVVSGKADLAVASWNPPALFAMAAEQTAAYLVAPPGAVVPLPGESAPESAPLPEWIAELVPASARNSEATCFRWPGTQSPPQFHLTQSDSTATFASAARLDLWIEDSGATEGWLGLKLAGKVPASVALQWPESARLTGLFVGGEFQPLPTPAAGRLSIVLPAKTSERLVWVAWVDPGNSLPLFSGELPARVPWPQEISVSHAHLNVHPPRHFRVEAAAPFHHAVADDGTDLIPPVVADADAADQSDIANPVMVGARSHGVSVVVESASEPGRPFLPGTSLTLINRTKTQLAVGVLVACALAGLYWKSRPLWNWISFHEKAAWTVLSIFWWLCLQPGWLGLVIAAWALPGAIRRRTRRSARSAGLSDIA